MFLEQEEAERFDRHMPRNQKESYVCTQIDYN